MKENLEKAIEQMKNGEEKGFNEIYSKTYNRVYFRARQIMKDEEEARDLTQIVFVEAYKSIASLQAPEALYSWLEEITYRQGMKIFRKKRDALLTEEAQIMFEELESNDISSMPELTADQKATSEIIRGIIEELPELQKTALVMYYYDGLKVEQIAEIMECSANTIKSRLNYARKYIKDKVEEKEKKEGYRLHVFGLPVFWFAIKTMADRTTLTAEEAQQIYNGSCRKVGLQARTLKSVSPEETMGATAGTTAKTTGIGARFASLSTGAKGLIIAGAVAVVVAGTVGAVYVAAQNNSENVREEQFEKEEYDEIEGKGEQKTVEQKEEATEVEKQQDTEVVAETETFTLTEEAGKQLSAFIGAYELGVYDLANMTDDDYLFLISDYIHYVQYEWNGTPTPQPGNLPYDWFNGNITPEEVKNFVSNALGGQISDGYSYTVNKEWGSLSVANGTLESTFDGQTIQVVGGTAEVVEIEGDLVKISGTYTTYDPDPVEHSYTISATANGNPDIFGGLKIMEYAEEAEGDIDYRSMAQRCVEVMESLKQQGTFSDMNGYYVYDIDKDSIPEIILCKGTCNADYEYVVYSYDGMNLLEKGTTTWGGTLYGYSDEKALAVQYIQMGYEFIFYYDMNTTEKISEKELQADYSGGYEFPSDAYELTAYYSTDEESVYQNIMANVQ